MFPTSEKVKPEKRKYERLKLGIGQAYDRSND
jgi:hypothetical protein